MHTGKVRLWTANQGSGTPILLCNGGPGCCDYLAPVAAMLQDRALVIRFEQRGCGRSDQIGPYDLETCLEDMEQIRLAYGIEKWLVGGHSWGPDLALAYAIKFPKRVLGLIGISGGVIHRDEAWRAQYHQLKETFGEEQPAYDFPPNKIVNREVNQSWREFVRRPEVLKSISQLDFPALYVYGEKDIRPSWPVEQLAQLFPNGHFELIKGAAHVIWLTHSQALEKKLKSFLNQHFPL